MYFWERSLADVCWGIERARGQRSVHFKILEDLIHLFTHSFIQHMLMESLLCVRQCLGTGNTRKQNKKKILPSWNSSTSGWKHIINNKLKK